ncbi:hypothetical protein GQ43DRAFT_384389, partial [Delitschia confertaspora ATCC 74209]
MDFAHAAVPHESTGYSPFELELGFKPRMHFDWEERTLSSATIKEQFTREEVQRYIKKRHDAVNWAIQNMTKAQAAQTIQANKKRREPNFGVGDWVYLLRKN